jgi:hypothetical protein
MPCYYTAYPYYPGGYIRRPWNLYADELYQASRWNHKNHWFSPSLSTFYLNNIGGGPWLSLSGNIFKFIGPYVDTFLILDGSSYLYGLRAGAHFSLFQTDPFSAAFYLQYQLWTGILTRQGATMGLDLRLYPVKPLALKAKFGFQAFDYVSLGEIELEAGIMLKSWEIFGGYRWWQPPENRDTPPPDWHGPYLGLRLFF